MTQWVTLLAGVGGLGFIGYCVYFDRKRRLDPDYKEKVMARRADNKKQAAGSGGSGGLPDLKDQQAVQRFFLEEVTKGEQLITEGDYEGGVKHLTNAIAVCGQPQQLLHAFKESLPPQVFQMLIQNLAMMGSQQMQTMMGGAGGGGGGGGPPPPTMSMNDTEGLD